MSVFINPLTDTGFKIIFGKEGTSEEFLMDFLNELFKGDSDLGNIVTLIYKNVERTPFSTNEKMPRYDIYCETNTGHRFIVEMQRQRKPNFMARTDYYVARGIADQGIRAFDQGEWPYDYLPVIGVFIADFYIDELPRKLVTITREMDTETLQPIGNRTRKAYIQLPAFEKSADDCLTGFEKWIYVLKNMETMREMPFKAMSDRVFERLGKVSRMSALSEEERISYDRDLKWALDYRAEMKYARDMAIKEGRQEGIEKGREEGRNEEKYIIARNFKNSGVDIHIISINTGLSEEEIAKL